MTELEMQSKLIRQQQSQINDLRQCNKMLERANQLLADALAAVLEREGRDRVFVPREGEKAEFRAEETLDGGGILLCRA
jgi:hypothetical protein